MIFILQLFRHGFIQTTERTACPLLHKEKILCNLSMEICFFSKKIDYLCNNFAKNELYVI